METVASLMDEIHENVDLLESHLPKQVEGFALSNSKLPWKVLLYREALIWRMVETGRSAYENFRNDKLVTAIILTRAAVETTAALWYLCAKVTGVIDSKALGDVDEYLMKLANGIATGQPDADSNGAFPPRPVRIKAFLKAVEKDLEGFRHQYGVLSEYAHPNWSGTVLLYSQTDKTKAITQFGNNIRGADNTKAIGVVNLSVALNLFRGTYDRIGDMLPEFIKVCESALVKRAG